MCHPAGAWVLVAAALACDVFAQPVTDAPPAADRSASAASFPARPARGPLSIADAFKPPLLSAVRLSPDGRTLAAIANTGKGRTVLLIDPNAPDAMRQLAPASAFETPLAVHWIGRELLVVSTFIGTHVVEASGKVLHQFRGGFVRSVRPNAKGEERFLLQGRKNRHYIERINARTADAEVVNFEMPGTPLRWIFDDAGNARAVSTVSTAFWSDDTTVTQWHRRAPGDKWEALATFPWLDVAWTPIAVARDGASLLVQSAQGRDTVGIFRYDPTTRQLGELMVGHPTEDLGPAERAQDSDDYQRVITLGMLPRTHWFDERWLALQKAVDAALPDRINVLQGDPRGKALVTSRGDVDPGTWLLLDTPTMKLQTIVSSRPHIDPAAMLPMRSVSYPSADGLLIPAYLTLPRDATGPVPAVVLVHGGPVDRDHWAWNPEVQMLASRGYAVLQPQFRGSAGFGKRFEEAGYGQWGLAMQDDVTAAANWLLAGGIAASGRVCVYGGSYGGYAAMWAMASTPTTFRCGISFAGVSDLNLMYQDGSDVNDRATGRLYRRKIVGDPKTRRQVFDEVSPVKRAAAVRNPVLIAHGNLDRRVPIGHAETLVKALQALQKSVEWISFSDEGHGLAKAANRERFYQAVFEFLDQHIGAGAGRVDGSRK